jgi:histidinol dehydrogenase
MFNIYDKNTALQTILKRVAADEISIPPSVGNKINQTFGKPLTPSEAVQTILADVKNNGDSALKNWTNKIDQVSLDEFRVPSQAFQEAIKQTDQALLDTLQTSIERVAAFHRRQPFSSWITQDLGGTLGQLLRPIRRVGLYVPGAVLHYLLLSSCQLYLPK